MLAQWDHLLPWFSLKHSGTDPPRGRDSSAGIGRAEANGCSLSGTSISPGFALMHSGIDLERGRPLRKQIYFCEDSVLDDHYVIGSRHGADSRQYAGNDTANGEVLAESPVVAQIYACEDAVLDGHYVIASRRGADLQHCDVSDTANGELLAECPVVDTNALVAPDSCTTTSKQPRRCGYHSWAARVLEAIGQPRTAVSASSCFSGIGCAEIAAAALSSAAGATSIIFQSALDYDPVARRMLASHAPGVACQADILKWLPSRVRGRAARAGSFADLRGIIVDGSLSLNFRGRGTVSFCYGHMHVAGSCSNSRRTRRSDRVFVPLVLLCSP